MTFGKFMLALPLAVAGFAVPALGDDMQGHNQAHQAMHGGAAKNSTEPGQGAFATIQEIAAILEADPSTDWSKVDLGRCADIWSI